MTVRSSTNETVTSFLNVYIEPLMMFAETTSSNNPSAKVAMTKVGGTDLESISQIFPNPATSKAYFDFVLSKEAEVTVSVINSQGKEIQSYILGKKLKGYNQQEIDVANLNAGLYFCKIATNSSFTTQKLIINH